MQAMAGNVYPCSPVHHASLHSNTSTVKSELRNVRGLLEKYPTFGREKETGLLGALDT